MNNEEKELNECPFCFSKNTYFSRKKKLYVCEDCDETFLEQTVLDAANNIDKTVGLKLFFSYGHDRNRPIVEKIKSDLEKRGHIVWIDTNEIKAGDSWRDEVLNGVLSASKIIAFLSEHSTRTPGVCLDELKIAVCVKGAEIKTVLLEPENQINPPATLSDIQWLDMSAWHEIKNNFSNDDFEKWYYEKFMELCSVVESNESLELNGDIHFLKTKLKPKITSEKEYSLLSKDFCNREWLKEHIKNWKKKTTGNSLVIYGKPGSGKSAFSVNYSHYNPDVYGCFLCEWNNEYTINPKYLVKTIAFRLATKIPDYRSMLLHQLEEDITLDEMDVETLFDFLLVYPLSHLVDGGRESGILIIDGLDEAECNGENPLARIFSKCATQLPKWIKFIFTSRLEKNVSKYFQSYDSIDIVDDMPNGYNDILAYFLKSLENEKINKFETAQKLTELSNGVFLYAELLVNDIKDGSIKLYDINSFPKGLSAFYRTSMERKFSSKSDFENIMEILEILSISESIPEELVRMACNDTQYSFLLSLDKLGSWVNRYKKDNLYLLGFSHKSIKDWFENRNKSAEFFVDYKQGAIKLAHYCEEYIDKEYHTDNASNSLGKYIKEHVGFYYIIAEQYCELERFLLLHSEELDLYWEVWSQFPKSWDNSKLLKSFWMSNNRNQFLKRLQKEGSVSFLLWILKLADDQYGVKSFDRELITIYIDIVHLSGDYKKAVDIANQYLEGNLTKIQHDEFLAMLSVRKIHHSMFYRPCNILLNEAMTLYSQLDDRYPNVYNELLFLIGGNLGVISGDWKTCKVWLEKSIIFSQIHSLSDFNKRNARKEADYYCNIGDYKKAEEIIKKFISDNEKINDRYEAYLYGSLANIYTCTGNDDEAVKCYEKLLKYCTVKGITGWIAHANLGLANICFKLKNYNDAENYANCAKKMYDKIKQEWGIIMSEALIGACESRYGTAPISVSCEKSIQLAKKMQYGSCVSSIEDLCNGSCKFLKLYFL